MAKFQLWSRDEYGQGSILMTSENVDDVIKRAKEEVTSINVNNALTTTDRERNWEAYFVEIKTAKNAKTKYIYGGLDVHTKDRVYAVTESDVKSIVLSEIPKKASVKIYLGNISTSRNEEKDWTGEDLVVRKVTSVDSPDLEGKISFFIKKV